MVIPQPKHSHNASGVLGTSAGFGNCFTWGANSQGQLGDDDVEGRSAPNLVEDLLGAEAQWSTDRGDLWVFGDLWVCDHAVW